MTTEQPNRDDQGTSHGMRQKAVEAYDSARDRVANAGRRAGDALDEAPLIALAGGLAAGALVGALLPRTQAESRMFGDMGAKLNDKARTAADAARQAGTDRLKELGLTPEAGTDALRNIIQGASDAAKTSAQAAFGSVRGGQQEG